MCWNNEELVPIVLKKPLKVYKIGTRLTKTKFVTAYTKYTYTKHTKLPTIQLAPDLYVKQSGDYMYRIFEGYHAFLTLNRAENNLYMDYDCIGEFEIPADALVYINFRSSVIVSSDIKYMGIIKDNKHQSWNCIKLNLKLKG